MYPSTVADPSLARIAPRNRDRRHLRQGRGRPPRRIHTDRSGAHSAALLVYRDRPRVVAGAVRSMVGRNDEEAVSGLGERR